jgi:hypothetical protein
VSLFVILGPYPVNNFVYKTSPGVYHLENFIVCYKEMGCRSGFPIPLLIDLAHRMRQLETGAWHWKKGCRPMAIPEE